MWLQTNSCKSVHACFTTKGWSLHLSVGDCTWTSGLCPSSQGLRSWRAFRDQYHLPIDVRYQHVDADSHQRVPALCSGSKVTGKLASKGRLVNHLCWICLYSLRGTSLRSTVINHSFRIMVCAVTAVTHCSFCTV